MWWFRCDTIIWDICLYIPVAVFSCIRGKKQSWKWLLMLLTQGRAMVVKKKTAKVEAVVLDEEKLQNLIGTMPTAQNLWKNKTIKVFNLSSYCVHWTIPCKWLLYSTCVKLSSALSFPASLSVDEAEDGVDQLARTLQSCLELSEPVQQIQLVKKVGFESGMWYNKKKKWVCCRLWFELLCECFYMYGRVSVVHQAGSQLESLTGDQPEGARLEACLHTLCLVYTSLQAKNPLQRAIARY